ncbi:hypothetical protein M422DRAFT_67673 [Sphaerobolus stellatus SS14]|uniref:Uncharacterized protein n=1 Tax=Sphaerobolus stellatus (strain SS14) TaxID=990650 RepID=A0A0C9VZM9_SPHS4|nr:hypothetical protein M422DRAFT_67673 [Sphaerobolus stellatus SS14]
MAAVYSVYTSPHHPPIPNHLPTLIVTPHGNPQNILYSYLHTNFNAENYLLTPSPQGELCVAKLFPPRQPTGAGAASDPGHGSSPSSRVVRCEASRNLKWTIANTGVMSPIYKLALPSPDSGDLPLFQISKPNPNAAFWSMFYFAYAGHNIPPKRIEFGKIQKNPPGAGGGGTRISITGKTPEEKAVWQTLGEGNEDCVEWVVLCAALNLLDDEIMKAAEKNPRPPQPAGGAPPQGVSLRDPGPLGPGGGSGSGSRGPPPPNGPQQRPPPPPNGPQRPPPNGLQQRPPPHPITGPSGMQPRQAPGPGPGQGPGPVGPNGRPFPQHQQSYPPPAGRGYPPPNGSGPRSPAPGGYPLQGPPHPGQFQQPPPPGQGFSPLGPGAPAPGGMPPQARPPPPGGYPNQAQGRRF